MLGLTLVTALVALGSGPALRSSIVVGVILAIAVLGNNVITGVLGEICLSASATMAVSAYAAAYFVGKGMSVELAAVAAVALASIVSLVIAVPTIRLHGIFAALATFALAYSVPTMAVYLKRFTGGDNGIGFPYPTKILGIDVSGSTTGAVVVPAAAFAILGAASLVFLESRYGRVFFLVGESEPAAEAFGLPPSVVKVLVWTWAGFLGSVAGVLYALNLGYVGPANFSSKLGILLLVGGVVAGARSTWGALIGGVLVGTVPPQIQDWVPATATGLVFGIVLLAVLASGRDVSTWVETLVARILLALRRPRHGTQPASPRERLS
jgi:branched-chain amino acid transport system permease protein